VPDKAKSKLNVGLRFKLLPAINLGVSYQRGDTFGVMVNLQFDLGKPIAPKRPDPPRWTPVDRRPFRKRIPPDMVEKIKTAIQEAGFKDVAVYTDGTNLTAEFENDKYLSNSKAAGRVLRILLFYSPVDTQKLSAILKRRKISILKVSVKPGHLEKYLFGEISEDIFFELVEVEVTTEEADAQPSTVIATKPDKNIDYSWGIKPNFQTYLNDLSGVFQFRVGVVPNLTSTFWKGGTATAWYNIPFYSDIDSDVSVPSDAVRSDSYKYLGSDLSFDRLMFDQAFRLTNKTFGRVSAGYLEFMYAGLSGEVLTFIGDGNLALGIEGDWVRKREPGTNLALMDVDKYDIVGNLYYYLNPLDLTLKTQYGRFMASDIGWRFQVGREYDTGIKIGGWYSLTDTSDLEGFNKDYNDKGVFLSIPTTIFTTNETNKRYDYAISPWTRDVAQTVYHWQTLFDLASDLMPGRFKSDLGDIKK
jgi:hypothetical protein